MDWGWTIGTVLALIGLGYAAMSGSRPHPQAARFFFVTASIVAFCKIATWGASVAMNTTLRIGLVGLSGAAVAVLLAEAIRYTFPPSPEVSEARQERAPPLPAPANATPSALSSSPQFGPDAVLASPTLPEKSKLVAKADEAKERNGVLEKLTQLYMASHDGISSEMMAGLEYPPAEYLNAELEKRGESWRVKDAGPGKVEIYGLR